MKLKLIVAAAVMAAVPLCAQAQQPKPSQMQPPKAAKITNADAQRVVKIISGDKAKTQAYCEASKLGEQIAQAEEKKDTKTADALMQKADALAQKIGPEYAALSEGLGDLDEKSKEGQAIAATLEGLDKLCPQ
jgi:hypothetical protein